MSEQEIKIYIGYVFQHFLTPPTHPPPPSYAH